MKLLFAVAVVLLNLIAGTSQAAENTYKKAIEERIVATKSYARARVLIAGISKQKSPSRHIFIKTLDKAEQHITDATTHLTKAREFYLDGFHSGEIEESSATKLRQQLKIQKNEIAELNLYMTQMRSRSLKKVEKKVEAVVEIRVEGPEGVVAEKAFLKWLSDIKRLQKSESVRWNRSSVTKNLWNQAVADTGFYGIHKQKLIASAAYAKKRKKERPPERL